jgi:glycosyltransferase involved in cell wall biosynthesis
MTFVLPKVEFYSGKQPENALYSIIIPTWNNLDYLQLCVKSIKQNSRFAHEIIFHINEGSDGTYEWVKKHGYAYTYTESNIGVCYALNIARSLAKTKYMVFVNDDHYLCPDWDFYLHEDVQTLATDYFYLSMTTIEAKGKNPDVIIRNFGNSIANFDEEGLKLECQYTIMKDWTGATGVPSLIPFVLWDLVGGLSIEYSPGAESDPDLSMKLWRAGVRYFKCISKSRAYHFGSVSAKRNNKGVNFFNARSKDPHIFYRKWGLTSNMFKKYYLRYGTEWKGTLRDPTYNSIYYMKSFAKQYGQLCFFGLFGFLFISLYHVFLHLNLNYRVC